jgi:hypothetical protein
MVANVVLAADTAPVGLADAAKKPDGYVSVMLLPAASSPPALVVNQNVAAAPVFPATRSAVATENEAPATRPPITPDTTPADAVTSALVDTEMPALLPAAAPMVRPSSVIVTAVLAALVADAMPQNVLRILFAVFMVFIAIRIWRGAERDAGADTPTAHRKP